MFNLATISIWNAISLLVSSGAIGYVIRLVIRIEVLEHLFNEKKDEVDDLIERQNKSESAILRLKDNIDNINKTLDSVSKSCETIPQINEKVTTILERIGTFVPREQIDEKISRLRDKVESNVHRIESLEHR